jgi:hypothetical protein
MNTNTEQNSYTEKLEALTNLYMELSLPLDAAIKAAEADLAAARSLSFAA